MTKICKTLQIYFEENRMFGNVRMPIHEYDGQNAKIIEDDQSDFEDSSSDSDN